ncbi:hypothetical protein LTR08_006425 [Meristemomyces frigidus]|nr:hypothetical protein LTR08_006425 [Meristemomyces frigidus]
MSFGISISDFIDVADRSRKVYRSCIDAPREYESLANSVNILRAILDDTRVHLEREVPDEQNKQKALVTARQSCENALDDIESLLKKYPSLGTQSSKKLIDRIRFINRDVDGLKEQLSTCGHNLERCLTSLMSVSMISVTEKLDMLLLEYKAGKHEKSVISLALVEGQRVDEDEVMDQLESNLLDKELHPDAFDLNRVSIRKWVLETITEDGFAEDEMEYQTAYEHQ